MIASTYLLVEWHITLLIPFSTSNDVSISVNIINFTLVSLKAAYQANLGAEKVFAASN